jgi:formylglycine-generating enzyme required for sulfatase activity
MLGSQRLRRIVTASMFTLLVGIIIGLVGWINQSYIAEQWRWWWTERPFLAANVWPHVLSRQTEQALKAGESFRECAPRQDGKDYCPEMIVVPAGSFMMGSQPNDNGAFKNEFPWHPVTIAKPFAVSKFELTFAEWDTCFAHGGCLENPGDAGWGRGEQPVIYVRWDDGQQYVKWLSTITGKRYRLLTEAEHEYATRAGATTAYPWGDLVGKNNANCAGCNSRWDHDRTAPAGSFAPNAFGLYDMVGNVWEWVEDCYHSGYEIATAQEKVRAPADGSAWLDGDCSLRVIRGGSWAYLDRTVRSASRNFSPTDARFNYLGFRVARTLDIR